MTDTLPPGLDPATLATEVTPIVRAAGQLALEWFRTPVPVDNKGGDLWFDPVTEADRATEDHLRTALSERYPAHRVVGEERGTTGPDDAPATWVIDPVDGTRAFVSGMPAWGVLVGLVVGGRAVAGWCHQPYLDELCVAVGGEGWMERDGERTALRTRRTTELARATMYSTHPEMFLTSGEQGALARLTEAVQLQRFGGDCYAYCLVAMGFVDLVVEANLAGYDIDALIPIIEAAGGVVTGPDGTSPVDGGFVVAAATPELHAEALAVVHADGGLGADREAASGGGPQVDG